MKLKVGILVSPSPSVSALFSMLFSALWLGCGELGMRKYSPRYLRVMAEMRRFLRIPVRILPSAFSPHFLRIFFHIGTRRNTRRFLRVPVRILPSAFSPHFLRIFFRIFCHTRMRRFLRVPVRILPSAFSPQGKCGDLGYGIILVYEGAHYLSKIQDSVGDANQLDQVQRPAARFLFPDYSHHNSITDILHQLGGKDLATKRKELKLTRTTRTPAFWGYPPPPHDYPHYWVMLDPKSKQGRMTLKI